MPLRQGSKTLRCTCAGNAATPVQGCFGKGSEFEAIFHRITQSAAESPTEWNTSHASSYYFR